MKALAAAEDVPLLVSEADHESRSYDLAIGYFIERVDDIDPALDPHRLQVTIMPAREGVVLTHEQIGPLVAEARQVVMRFEPTLESIWTPAFFRSGPHYNIENAFRPGAFGLDRCHPIADGTCLITVTMATAKIAATPNRRGRPGVHGTLSDPYLAALSMHTRRTIQYLKGCYSVAGDADPDAKAFELLEAHALPLAPLHHHWRDKVRNGSGGAKKADAEIDIAMRLTYDMSKKGSSRLAKLYPGGQHRQVLRADEQAGAAEASGNRRVGVGDLPGVKWRVMEFDGLVDLRIASHHAARADEELKRQMNHQDASDRHAGAGYVLDPEERRKRGLVSASTRLPGGRLAVWLAHEYEVNAYDLIADRAWLRPVTAAAVALGAYERRGEKPSDPYAVYGLKAWAAGFRGLQAEECLAAMEMCPSLPADLVPADDELPTLEPVLPPSGEDAPAGEGAP